MTTTNSPRYLIDTSVLLRGRQPRVGERIEEMTLSGRHWTCRMIDLELLRATRAGDVLEAAEFRRNLPEAPITASTWDRALRIIQELAAQGIHSSVHPADCLIAACAEHYQLTVLHYDRDFDRIAGVTGQETEWVAPAGTLDK